MLRGVAVLMVLIYHMGIYEGKASADAILSKIPSMGQAGVDIFFVISGFVMITISVRPRKAEDKPGEFLMKRAIRIYPLYWFYTAVALAIFWLRPDLANRSGGVEQTSVPLSLLLLPDKSGAPIVGQGWTLIHEMYFYLVFSLSLIAKPFLRNRLLAVWAVIVVFGAYACNPSSNVWLNLILNPLTLEFLGGCWIAWMVSNGWRKMGKTAFILGAISLVYAGTPYFPKASVPREFAFGIPALLIVYGAIAMERTSGFVGPRFLKTLGDASYSIYLSHIFCLSTCLLVWKRFKAAGPVDNLVVIAAMGTVSLAVGLASYRYLEKPLQRLGRLVPNGKTALPK
ncbi:MAG TPA: acyltransferase, partial [Luteolibacter sp.]